MPSRPASQRLSSPRWSSAWGSAACQGQRHGSLPDPCGAGASFGLPAGMTGVRRLGGEKCDFDSAVPLADFQAVLPAPGGVPASQLRCGLRRLLGAAVSGPGSGLELLSRPLLVRLLRTGTGRQRSVRARVGAASWRAPVTGAGRGTAPGKGPVPQFLAPGRGTGVTALRVPSPIMRGCFARGGVGPEREQRTNACGARVGLTGVRGSRWGT